MRKNIPFFSGIDGLLAGLVAAHAISNLRASCCFYQKIFSSRTVIFMRTFAMHYKPTPIILNDFFVILEHKANWLQSCQLGNLSKDLRIFSTVLEFFFGFLFRKKTWDFYKILNFFQVTLCFLSVFDCATFYHFVLHF